MTNVTFSEPKEPSDKKTVNNLQQAIREAIITIPCAQHSDAHIEVSINANERKFNIKIVDRCCPEFEAAVRGRLPQYFH